MHLPSYLQCILELGLSSKSRKKSIYTHSTDSITKTFIESLDCKFLFFDIDDTLTSHGGSIHAELSEELNQFSDSHQVVLLTNCGKKREKEHQANIQKYNCKAELWEVGKKPNYRWFFNKLNHYGWPTDKCAFFGDRISMDLWMAYKCNFKHRVHVTTFQKEYNHVLISPVKIIEKWILT